MDRQYTEVEMRKCLNIIDAQTRELKRVRQIAKAAKAFVEFNSQENYEALEIALEANS